MSVNYHVTYSMDTNGRPFAMVWLNEEFNQAIPKCIGVVRPKKVKELLKAYRLI
nr:MAG TPA: hypothetical protein [Caudoviricetes sp.]